jgi:hypothetical protein
VRVRLFELRLLAVALTLLWAAGGGIVLIDYRPGGPWDLLVGVSASLPLLVSVAAIVWPPLVTSNRGAAGVFWIGLLAGLLLVPSVASVAAQVLAHRSTPLLPSAEVVYPWALALVATGLFAGLGISRQLIAEAGIGRKRLAVSIAFALATSLVIGSVFAGVSLADNLALRDKPAAQSRFGPTDPALTPPECDQALSAARTAQLDMEIGGDVDGRSIGTIDLAGTRSSSDVSWTAWVYSRDLLVKYGSVRIGQLAWSLEPGKGWQPVDSATLDDDLVDATVLAHALAPGDRATAEDRGLEFVEGAQARRCRVAVDGDTFAASFPQARWLTGEASLTTWRGELDYWIFGDGGVGQVEGLVNGNAQAILPHGLLATVRVTLTATDRGKPVYLAPPGQ